MYNRICGHSNININNANYKSMTESYTLELDGGYHVEVEYEYSPAELDYVNGTGYQGGVTVHNIYANLPDANDKLIKVDVLHFLSTTGLIDTEEVEELIERERS